MAASSPSEVSAPRPRALTRRGLILRGLAFHWRSHLAVLLGVATAGAALTGALLVGDSMRASLRGNALERLGAVDHAVTAPRYFRETLADALDSAERRVAPVILARGSASHARSHARANQIAVLGADDRFWALHAGDESGPHPALSGRKAALNRSLAQELDAQVGDAIILRLGKPQDVSTDTLLGRRDETTTRVRLTVSAILDDRGLGAFTLDPQPVTPKNVYLPLAGLQRVLDQPGKCNTLLVASGDDDAALPADLEAHLDLPDLGLSLRVEPDRGYLALESDALLIAPAFEAAAQQAFGPDRIDPVITYLANAITFGDREIPYSTVAAIAPAGATAEHMRGQAGQPVQLADGQVLLTRWAADDLRAKAGDRITLRYYVTGALGHLETVTTPFTVAGIVEPNAAANDPGFTPPYPGVTDVERLADWSPPFPVDLKRIRPRDEDYWEKHKTAPKAFVALADGERLWAEPDARLGRYTALRLPLPAETDPAEWRRQARAKLLDALSPESAGFAVRHPRRAARAAGRGSTDFSGLFIGFSFFLIASAAMLVALLFRLAVARRAREVGLLLALGFSKRQVIRGLLAEGAVVSVLGAVIGALAGVGYARLMLLGLRSWWSEAANAPFLRFAATPTSYFIGIGSTVFVALIALVWGVREMRRRSTNRLLAGARDDAAASPDLRRLRRRVRWPAIGAALLAAGFVAGTLRRDWVSPTLAFFAGGSAVLLAGIAAAAYALRAYAQGHFATHAQGAITQLGLRNAARHPGRSLLIIALIASATFITTALQAFRLAAPADPTDPSGGTGGYTLIAESAAPLPYDLNTPQGRSALNMTAASDVLLAQATCMPFRLRPGDDTSCLNLYQPTQPRILGVPCAQIARGGFSFSAVDTADAANLENPWTLLERDLPDGAIPVIGDEAAVLWQLHSKLGGRIEITDESGKARPLQFVALLKGSVLQEELLIAEDRFKQLFPSISGHAFFLVETGPADPGAVRSALETDLENFGMDVERGADRLRAYFAVQNTYLSTFQMLGGFGIALGSIGLVAVMLRNLSERRGELALMQAVGFRRNRLGRMLLIENGALIVTGLLIGVMAALLAIAPRWVDDPAGVAWGAMLLVVVSVPLLGVGVAAGVLRRALRAPLIPALRRE
jgi:putative ABC transport system permease protein